MDYASCWELQRSLFDALVAAKRAPRAQKGEEKAETTAADAKSRAGSGATADKEAGTVLLVEHPPVYTLGKSGRAENLLIDRATLERLGAEFFHIDRGGDITFHGPGQLVCYPILDLERLGIGLREYIDRLEEAVIRTVAHYGIAAGRMAGASGVWVPDDGPKREAAPKKEGPEDERPEEAALGKEGPEEETLKQEGPGKETPGGETAATAAAKEVAADEAAAARAPRKICAIGVRSSRYVTMHGFALNVATDLGWFSRINPCGFSDRGVTSIVRETGRNVAMDETKRLLLRELERQFDLEIRP